MLQGAPEAQLSLGFSLHHVKSAEDNEPRITVPDTQKHELVVDISRHRRPPEVLMHDSYLVFLIITVTFAGGEYYI